eukprot:gene12068-25295_t
MRLIALILLLLTDYVIGFHVIPVIIRTRQYKSIADARMISISHHNKDVSYQQLFISADKNNLQFKPRLWVESLTNSIKTHFRKMKIAFATVILGMVFLLPVAGAKASSLSGSRMSASSFQTEHVSTKASSSNSDSKTKQNRADSFSSNDRYSASGFHHHKSRPRNRHQISSTTTTSNRNTILISSTTASSLMPLLFATFILFQIPLIKSHIKMNFNMWAVAYHELQLAYLVTDNELQDFFRNLEQISKKYKNMNDSHIFMTEEFCVNCLRLKQSLVAGSFKSQKRRDTISNRENFIEQLRIKSMLERAKYTVETSPSTSTSTNEYSPKYNTNTNTRTHGHHIELRRSPSYLILTMLLVTVGPVLKKPPVRYNNNNNNPLRYLNLFQWLKTRSWFGIRTRSSYTDTLLRSDVDQILQNIPTHVRSLHREQQRVRTINNNVEKDEEGVRIEEPGFEIEILWTPDS